MARALIPVRANMVLMDVSDGCLSIGSEWDLFDPACRFRICNYVTEMTNRSLMYLTNIIGLTN